MAEDNNPEVMYKLGRIESLVEAMDKKLDTHISDTKATQEDHEHRISTLEKKEVRYATLATMLGVSGGFLVEVVAKWLNLH